MSKINLSLKTLPADERKVFWKTIWRTLRVSLNYNFVRQMGHGCAYAMAKYLEWLYPKKEDREKRVEAFKRESVFYNITPEINTLGIGLFSAMEKEYRDHPDTFDPATINNIKIAIMGPTAGIGDTIYWVTIRVLCTTIALPFALAGSIWGMIIFTALYVAVHFAGLYSCGVLSYKAGSNFIMKAIHSGILPMLTKAASIMGMVMIGAMISSSVKVPLTVQFGTGEQITSLLDMFDSIMPGLLGLLLSLGCFKLIRKKINPNWILVGTIAVGLLGALVGIF